MEVECEGSGAYINTGTLPGKVWCTRCETKVAFVGTAQQLDSHTRPMTKAEILLAGDAVFRSRLRIAREA